jgi:hypothetical protein
MHGIHVCNQLWKQFYCCPVFWRICLLLFSGIDFKIKTVELGGKKIKLQIWWVQTIANLINNKFTWSVT